MTIQDALEKARDSQYARMLMRAYGLANPSIPPDIFVSNEVSGLEQTENPDRMSGIRVSMRYVIFKLRMRNLRVQEVQNFNRDSTTIRIVIDSKGWTG